jgi:hypothetical protein
MGGSGAGTGVYRDEFGVSYGLGTGTTIGGTHHVGAMFMHAGQIAPMSLPGLQPQTLCFAACAQSSWVPESTQPLSVQGVNVGGGLIALCCRNCWCARGALRTGGQPASAAAVDNLRHGPVIPVAAGCAWPRAVWRPQPLSSSPCPPTAQL